MRWDGFFEWEVEMIKIGHLKQGIEKDALLQHELIDDVLSIHSSNKTTRIERIVSMGHCQGGNEWSDQAQSEWVILLTGGARLEFFDPEQQVDLKPFDYITIEAHCRHRVIWTDPDEVSIWLAVFGDF